MAKVDFYFETQESMNALSRTGPVTVGSLSAAFDIHLRATQLSSQLYAVPISWEIDAQSVHFSFPNEVDTFYEGLVLSDPNASHGTGTATSYGVRIPFGLYYDAKGEYRFTYDVVGSALVVKMLSVTKTEESILILDEAGIKTPFGDYGGWVVGNWQVLPNGDVSGTLNELNFKLNAPDTYGYVQVKGSFSASGNTAAVTSGTAHSSVNGIVDSFMIPLPDAGSEVKATGLHTHLGSNDALDLRFLTDPSHFSGDDVINFGMTQGVDLVNDQLLAAGDGNDVITVTRGGDKLRVDAGSGNDLVNLISGTHDVDGGSGRDTVYITAYPEQVTVTAIAGGFTVTEQAYGTHVLNNVERLEVGTRGLAMDIAGNAGQAYRIYQAAFDRKPDVDGLSFWIGALDRGAALRDVASGFIKSEEFQSLYGSNTSNKEFLTLLYNNVLHRAPDAGGLDFWLGAFGRGAERASVLAEFSESAENQAQVIGDIQNGIVYNGLLVHTW